MRVLERPDLLDDPRFRTRDDRLAHRAELKAELELTLRTRTAAEWDQILLPSGVPAAAVVTVPEALRSAQVRHRRLVSLVPSPAAGGGMLSVLGSPTHVDGSAVAPRSAPPLLGEHTDAVLADLGYAEEEIARLHEEGAV